LTEVYNGYPGAISKGRNFSGWQRNIANRNIMNKWGNAKIALPHHFMHTSFQSIS
jgi:hypothetical protein